MSHQLYPPRDPEVHTLETLGLQNKPQQLLEDLADCISNALGNSFLIDISKYAENGDYIGDDPAKDAWNVNLETLQSVWDNGIPHETLKRPEGATAKRIHSHLEAAVDELVKYLHQRP